MKKFFATGVIVATMVLLLAASQQMQAQSELQHPTRTVLKLQR
jgi:hypothetical protein